jgi:hypothetical protein
VITARARIHGVLVSRPLFTARAGARDTAGSGGFIVTKAKVAGEPLMRFVFAIAAAALTVYLNGIAESRWYPLDPDMGRWLMISLALFVFLVVLKILAPPRTSTD